MNRRFVHVGRFLPIFPGLTLQKHYSRLVLYLNPMDARLKPELEEFLNRTVQSGHYRSTEEALNKAVQLLKEREEAEAELEAKLQEGENSDPAIDMTVQDWAEIEKEGLRRLRSRKSA
jgi:putative addiction module CopG family antidote